MVQRGRAPEQSSNPMDKLDAAMSETLAEIDQQGTGVDVQDVAREQRPRRERREQARPSERTEGTPSRRSQVDDGDDDTTFEVDEAEDDTTATPRRDTRSRRPGRASDTDAADSEDDDEEDDDLEDDDEEVADGRVQADDAEEDDEDDSHPEGREQDEDDEEEGERRPRRRGRKRLSKRAAAEIERRVNDRVSKVIEERDRLRAAQAQQQQAEGQAIEFLLRAIGTPEDRRKLQQIVNNTDLPIAQRNAAADTLRRYEQNHGYVGQYRVALQADIRNQHVGEIRKVAQDFTKYGIKPRDEVLASGNVAQVMVETARAAIVAERARNAKEVETLKRQLATAQGSNSERAVRDGMGRFTSGNSRPSNRLASANGRGANGRQGRPNGSMRGMLEQGRGIGSDSKIVTPTDDLLAKLRNGEMTFADLPI